LDANDVRIVTEVRDRIVIENKLIVGRIRRQLLRPRANRAPRYFSAGELLNADWREVPSDEAANEKAGDEQAASKCRRNDWW
jgi:hypothetical protein